jgi:hypothetical protein
MYVGGVRLNMTSAAALARVAGTYAVTWEECLVEVVRVLRSAAFGRRRVGVRARQGGGVDELEAREGIVSSNVALRPPVTPNIDCPIVHHLPLHCIALQPQDTPTTEHTSPPRRTAASLAAAHCPPPPSSELVPSPSHLLPATPTLAPRSPYTCCLQPPHAPP